MQDFWQVVWDGIKPMAASVAAGLIIVLLGYAASWVKAQAAHIKSKVVREAVEGLVQAAEQKADLVAGPDKLAWVSAKLAERGIPADEDDIEAAVYWISAGLKAWSQQEEVADDGAA